MGNGDKELKNKVEYKTDRFDEGGIYNGLKKFELIQKRNGKQKK